MTETPFLRLKELTEKLEGFPAAPSGQTSTYRVLAQLANSLATGKGPTNRNDVEALCRKIHVAKRVDAAYGPKWKKLTDRTDVDLSAWPLIIRILLGFSDSAAWTGPEAEGLAMKCLNAALAAMDLARAATAEGGAAEGGAEALVEFEEALGDRLKRISREASK